MFGNVCVLRDIAALTAMLKSTPLNDGIVGCVPPI
jgi:hypothetical protein